MGPPSKFSTLTRSLTDRQHDDVATKVSSVDDFLDALEPRQRVQVAELRRVILTAVPQLIEHIKWHSPSYIHEGIDRLTINVRNRENAVQLILHMDTARPEDRKAEPVMADDTGLVRWLSDIRGVITLQPGASVVAVEADLASVVTRWVRMH
jgi:hypothetical protein